MQQENAWTLEKERVCRPATPEAKVETTRAMKAQVVIIGAVPTGLLAHLLQGTNRHEGRRSRILPLLLLVLTLQGCTLTNYLTISERKLEHPNPTSYTFSAPPTRVRDAIIKSFGPEQPCSSSCLVINRSRESEIDLYQVGVTNSDIYYSRKTSLKFKAEFTLQLSPTSDSKTEVSVHTTHCEVLMGPNLGGDGGDNFKYVHPTSIEEYRILLKIGDFLGEKGMPPLQLPR